jgi:hypothetical protein
MFKIERFKCNYFAERIGITNFTIAQTGIEGKAICYISHDADLDKTSNVFHNYFYKFCFSDMCKDIESIGPPRFTDTRFTDTTIH